MSQIKLSNNNANSRLQTTLKWLLLLVVVVGLVLVLYVWKSLEINSLNQQISELKIDLNQAKNVKPSAVYNFVSTKGVAVKVYTPIPGNPITNPTVVMGEVPGNWSFEASFPVKIVDSDGKVISQTLAQLNGDWMTDKPVSFWAKLEPETAITSGLKLILEKDNPSGLPENDDSVSINL